MDPAYSAHWKRLIGASLAVLAAAFIGPRFIPAPDLVENRTLAPPPAIPHDLDGWRALRPALDAYVADHFPPRAQLIGALNALRMQIGVSGSDRVVVGRDGWLFFDNGSHLGAARDVPMSPAAQQAWLEALAGRSESLAATGAAYLVVIAPAKESIYPEKAPAWFHLAPDRNAVRLARLARQADAGQVLYLAPAMAKPARWGLKLYSRHDTHWTGLGAYEGYAAIMRRLQEMGRVAEGPRPVEAFAEIDETVQAEPRDLALMLGVASFVDVDYPQLTDPPAIAALQTTWLGEGRDWTKPHVVDTGQAGKPVLLMTMDSFSNALLPFLYGHFSRIVLAHDQDGTWREDLIQRFQPDIVLLEVTESGAPHIMNPAPPPSPEARARILDVLPRAAAPAQPERKVEAAPIRRVGGPESELIDGGPGADDLQGRVGDDTLNGLAGPDALRGGRGDDILDGGPGADWLAGGRGDDTVTGGPGADTFNSFAGADLDVVTDFNPAEGDRVELDPGTVFTLRQDGPDTVVEMEGARLVLKGVRAADLPKGAVTAR